VLVTVVLAVLVTVAAVLTVFLLRPDHAASPGPAADAPAVSASSGTADCPDDECRVFASAEVGSASVELLADPGGTSGRVRIDSGTGRPTVLESSVTAMGARLDGDSLRCAEGDTPVCLVHGALDDGTVGEVMVARGATWRPADRPYFSDAGTIALDDVTGDPVPEVVVVRHDCDASDTADSCRVAPVVTAVFEVGGAELGCTGHYTSPGEILGWPEVRVSAAQLRPCG
jgi:hypothetical protein